MSNCTAPLLSVVRALTCAACLLVVFSCAAPPPKATSREAYTSPQNPIQQAQLELDKAADKQSPERDSHLIRAADLFAGQKRYARAEEALKQVNASLIDTPLLARYTLLYATIALQDERYYLARSLLNNEQLSLNVGEMSADQRRTWHQQRGELYALLGDHLLSVQEYSQLGVLLDDRAEIAAIHDKIWHALGQVSEQMLRAAASSTTDTTLAGWYQLSLFSRDAQGDIARQLDQIATWRQTNSNHPAARVMPTSLQRAAEARGALPRSLALLLPLSGDLASVGEALRDGILAAYYGGMAKGVEPPAVRIYDSSSGDPSALYDQAVEDGADLVIGPLAKDKLQSLMARPTLAVPVLGLNYVDDTPNPHANLYQFGLAVGDETRQLADRAWIHGRRSALVIRPDTMWGNNALETFRQRWDQKGGLLLTTTPYRADQLDYATFLRSSLLLSDSQERAARLQRTLGKNVNYIPRRRQDVDMVLLLAYPEQGRQLKPTLDFLFASDLPIYATSHIYGGSANPSQDQDLDGIQFTAMPWTIPALAETRIAPHKPLATAYRNLFAMGVDAYRLHQWLALLQAMPETSIQGQTGSLAMGPENHVTRTQPLAAFRGGRVIVAPTVVESGSR